MKKGLLIFSILLISLISIQCNNDKKKDRPKTHNGELKPINYSFENPPKFRKDGELWFLQNETNKELFKIDLEIASTDEERARGLMFRPEMEENQGMIFLFYKDEIQSFYMRNTIISLDIIYVNSDKEIVDIYKNTNILDDTSLPSKAPAMYVVEINGGLCDKYQIKEGDLIQF
ncbi:MAG TPA: DUF192 domain-containing protein [Bacteroidales bacterium]|nr:DUF192 domain-containing protein [Bacteroidales bacterium]